MAAPHGRTAWPHCLAALPGHAGWASSPRSAIAPTGQRPDPALALGARRVGKDARLRTPVCDALGMEYPIFAFSHCRDVVAAVTNAGGFGVFGALGSTPARLEEELRWIDEQVRGKPYGVDIVLPAKSLEDDHPAVGDLAAMIPEEHRAFLAALLDRHGVHVEPGAPMRVS